MPGAISWLAVLMDEVHRGQLEATVCLVINNRGRSPIIYGLVIIMVVALREMVSRWKK